VVVRARVVRRLAGLRGAFAAPLREPVPDALAALERLAAVELERLAGLRVALVLRAPPVELDFTAAGLPPPDGCSSSPVQLPDITRCAASATASAMIEPNRVALAIMLLAADDAVSAASRPASRILRRAPGLALIAAAAAARPAASISLLIAALASLSTVLSLDLDDFLVDDFRAVDFLVVDFAIAVFPSVAWEKTLQRRNGSQTSAEIGHSRIC
jgi:hypothetical protein